MKFIHIALLAIEVGLLVAMPLLFWIRKDEDKVVQGSPWFVIILIALGIGLLVAWTFERFLLRESGRAPYRLAGNTIGMLLVGIGGLMAYSEFPTAFRMSSLLGGTLRWQRIGAVSVSFDASGGKCGDSFRVTKCGATYGRAMNVYPSEDERRMRLLNAKLDLYENAFETDVINDTSDQLFVNYFTMNVIPHVFVLGKWTYVVDVESMTGTFAAWEVGQTSMTNNNVYSELSYGRIPSTITAGKKKFLVLESTSWGEKCNMLDRAYIHLKPGQQLKAKFRVSLFAGTGVNESNYRYVKPGETIVCPLPVPSREGYAFEGWYDGERRITEESKVEKREAHKLKARWRKL